MDDLLNALDRRLDRRALQRRLASLIKQGKLRATGRGRASRYRLPRVAEGRGEVTVGVGVEGRGELRIPLSTDGEVIEKIVRQPLQNRQPVGYRRHCRTRMEAEKPDSLHGLDSAAGSGKFSSER